MTVVRNWRDATPHVGHQSVIVHYVLGQKAEGKTYEEAPIEGEWSLTRHAIQGGKEGDYHVHDAAEQVFYYTKGTGQMKIDDKLYDVREGDAVHVPPRSYHQNINNSDDWLELLIITAQVGQGSRSART